MYISWDDPVHSYMFQKIALSFDVEELDDEDEEENEEEKEEEDLLIPPKKKRLGIKLEFCIIIFKSVHFVPSLHTNTK